MEKEQFFRCLLCARSCAKACIYHPTKLDKFSKNWHHCHCTATTIPILVYVLQMKRLKVRGLADVSKVVLPISAESSRDSLDPTLLGIFYSIFFS